MASDECFVIKRGRRSSKTRKILPAKQAMPAAGEARRRRSSPQARLGMPFRIYMVLKQKTKLPTWFSWLLDGMEVEVKE